MLSYVPKEKNRSPWVSYFLKYQKSILYSLKGYKKSSSFRLNFLNKNFDPFYDLKGQWVWL